MRLFLAPKARVRWTSGARFSSSARRDTPVPRMVHFQAGLADRSSHGIRKAVAVIMAKAWTIEHQIKAGMAHTQAKTSEIRVRGAARRILAADGMQALSAPDW